MEGERRLLSPPPKVKDCAVLDGNLGTAIKIGREGGKYCRWGSSERILIWQRRREEEDADLRALGRDGGLVGWPTFLAAMPSVNQIHRNGGG